VAVAEELHFRRAADRLYVAQPAVSEQVRKLEAELGVQLFNRTHRSVSLTDAGAALLEEARRVLHQADIAQMAARNAAQRTTQRLRIGHLPELLPDSVARAVRMLGTRSPRVQISLETGPALRLIEQLRAHQLDAAIVGLPVSTNGLRVTPTGGEHAVAAVPSGHQHAATKSIAIERLAPERVILPPRDANPAFHSAVVSICRAAGLSPVLVELAEANTEHALLAVAGGDGVALLPASAAERHIVPGVRLIAVESAEPAFESAVLTLPGVGDELAAARFVRAVAHASRTAPEVPSRASSSYRWRRDIVSFPAGARPAHRHASSGGSVVAIAGRRSGSVSSAGVSARSSFSAEAPTRA
jgi:DNA-binding transcriptional LysR family regulator